MTVAVNTSAKWHNSIRSPHIRRIMNADGLYLHMSGTGWVKKTDYAWSGLKSQGRLLVERGMQDGEDGFEGCKFKRVNPTRTTEGFDGDPRRSEIQSA